MQPSDQQPVEETEKQDAAEEQLAHQPLYEFPPDGPMANVTPQPSPITKVLPSEELENNAIDEAAIQQGQIYPPPPSYYQNMSTPPAQPPASPDAPNMYAPPQGYMPQGNAQTYQAYPPPATYPPMPQPPAKKSYRWVWILVAVVSVLVLAGCGLCGWASYNIFNSAYQQVSGSINVVNDFYTNLQSKNYTAAYTDLAPEGQISGLTQAAFTTQAQQLDEKYGPVASFVLSQPTFRTDPNTGSPDLSHFTMTVAVKRTHSSYNVLLSLAKIHGTWKITEYDRL
ncbi:MAG: hypothetical protein E6I59_05280 [Chloroflexi bacterium]|nr:MAG: hypothetical protein E6I59_05280 [Chloroflexota bacterium]